MENLSQASGKNGGPFPNLRTTESFHKNLRTTERLLKNPRDRDVSSKTPQG
jgi:hypothetical protein